MKEIKVYIHSHCNQAILVLRPYLKWLSIPTVYTPLIARRTDSLDCG